MRYHNLICAATLLFLASCTSTTNSKLPANPKDREVYKDENGSKWIWNAAMGYWMMRAANGAVYNYHPTTGKFTNAAGSRVTPPSQIANGIGANSDKDNGRAVFGRTGRGISVSS